MKSTLFLAWQDAESRKWFTVGRFHQEAMTQAWEFQYLRGAERAQEEAGFDVLAAFPDFYQTYKSSQMFPLLRNRLMSSSRGDYGAYLAYLGFDPDEPPSDMQILARSGGSRATDRLELFPQLEPRPEGRFSCEFFLRRRHFREEQANHRFDAEVLSHLEKGQPLQLAIEFNNPGGYLRAVQLQSLDMEIMGYTPNYLVEDLCAALFHHPEEMRARVLQVNPSPAPRQRRVLVQVEGRYPEGRRAMAGPDFEPLTPLQNSQA